MTANSPDESKDMKRLAICRSIEPTTCFDASKAHTFRGRCGLSRHLLYTSDSNASNPSDACMTSAKGPNNRHSPFSAPGRESGLVVTIMLEVVATMAITEEEVDVVPRAEFNGGVETCLRIGVGAWSNGEKVTMEGFREQEWQ